MIINPLMIDAMRLAQSEPVAPNANSPVNETDARRFEDLLNAGQPAHEAATEAETARDSIREFKGGTNFDQQSEPKEQEGHDVLVQQWPPTQHAMEPLKVSEPVAKVDTTARVEVAQLVEQIADRIIIEGPTSSQPAVEIHLAPEVLPDTTIRVTRTDEGLEVALMTANADSHNILTGAVADLGARLTQLVGAAPVLISVAMHGGETTEFSFSSGPGSKRGSVDRQRKVTRGHA